MRMRARSVLEDMESVILNAAEIEVNLLTLSGVSYKSLNQWLTRI